MKTIVIIETETLELEALVNLFRQWQQEINILTASEEQAAITIMSEQQVDLVVCDLAMPNKDAYTGFSMLTNRFPYVPCIALSGQKERQKHEALKRGASHCLEKPIDTKELLQHAKELLETGTSGTMKGIPIHSFLQMLESEEKTCTLQVDRKKDTGRLYIKDGILIGAETKNFIGEEAACSILTWDEIVVEIKYFNCQRKQEINKPLIEILMESFRLKNEKDKLLKKSKPIQHHQLPLKHLSTQEAPISIDLGTIVKMEFPYQDTPQKSTMVGMQAGKFIIITTPTPFSTADKMNSSEQRIILKYVQSGRIWMFKSQLLKSIDFPAQLLFLEYPSVIHYHELRKSKRTNIFVPCTFHLPAQAELYGNLTDLNGSGALFQVKNSLEESGVQIDIGQRVQLRCLLPGMKEEQELFGTVRNLKKDDTSTKVGLEFQHLQPHLIETINKYLYTMESARG